MEQQCHDCRYWDGKPNAATNSFGDCRRYAPRPGETHGWPHTKPGDWCGEFEPKPDNAGLNL